MKLKLILLISIVSSTVLGQVSFEGNNSVNSNTDYVGWDAATNDPLNIEHKGNLDINWHIDNVQRMQLSRDENVTIAGHTVHLQLIQIPRPMLFT